MEFIIKTERIGLRQFEVKDAKALNEIANQDHILERMPDWESSIEKTKRLIKFVSDKLSIANKYEARILLAVVLLDTLEIIGMVGIGNKEEVDNEIEIAYFISKEHMNKGYISEAAKAASRWAIEYLNLNYLIAIVEPDNFPSIKVVERSGFKQIETRLILNSGETEEKPFYYYRLYNSEE